MGHILQKHEISNGIAHELSHEILYESHLKLTKTFQVDNYSIQPHTESRYEVLHGISHKPYEISHEISHEICHEISREKSHKISETSHLKSDSVFHVENYETCAKYAPFTQ